MRDRAETLSTTHHSLRRLPPGEEAAEHDEEDHAHEGGLAWAARVGAVRRAVAAAVRHAGSEFSPAVRVTRPAPWSPSVSMATTGQQLEEITCV